MFSTQEQKQKCLESLRKPQVSREPFSTSCWRGARISDQAVNAADVEGVRGRGGRYLRLRSSVAYPSLRLRVSDRRIKTALLPTCLRSHSPTEARLHTVQASQCQALPPGLLTLPKYYGRLRYLKKNHQQPVDPRQIPYASLFCVLFQPSVDFFPTLPDENTVINSMQWGMGEGFLFFFFPLPRLEKKFWQIIWLNMKRERLLTAVQIKC